MIRLPLGNPKHAPRWTCHKLHQSGILSTWKKRWRCNIPKVYGQLRLMGILRKSRFSKLGVGLANRKARTVAGWKRDDRQRRYEYKEENTQGCWLIFPHQIQQRSWIRLNVVMRASFMNSGSRTSLNLVYLLVAPNNLDDYWKRHCLESKTSWNLRLIGLVR